MHEIFLQSYHMKWVCGAPQKETLKLISLTSCDINQISILFNKEKTKVCLEILQLSSDGHDTAEIAQLWAHGGSSTIFLATSFTQIMLQSLCFKYFSVFMLENM